MRRDSAAHSVRWIVSAAHYAECMPDTRSALLDSAIRLLDAGGVEAVTLREVGLGAGVNLNS